MDQAPYQVVTAPVAVIIQPGSRRSASGIRPLSGIAGMTATPAMAMTAAIPSKPAPQSGRPRK